MAFSMPAELLAILADPETKEPVHLASDAQLANLQRALAQGKARRKDGGEVPETFDAAFLSGGGQRAYLVIDGIPNFLIDERIELDEAIG